TPTAEAATSRSTRARVSGVRCQFTHPISTPSQEEISDTQSDSSEASVKVAVKSMVALYTGARRLPSLFHGRSARIARRVLVQSATDPTVCRSVILERRGSDRRITCSTTPVRSGPSAATETWMLARSGAMRASYSPRTVMVTSLMELTLRQHGIARRPYPLYPEKLGRSGVRGDKSTE